MSAARASNSAALALLNQEGGIADVLRSALQAFGASIVYEAQLQALDRGALKASGARIVVINLGDNEDALDDIQDLLESTEYEIVVNDSAVSAQLTGFDQARWVRHLAAKILRRPEIVLPPRPAGAVAPPTFEQHWAARVPVAEVIGDSPATVAKPVAAPVTPAPIVAAPVPAAPAPVEPPPRAAATPLVSPEIERPVSTEDAHLELALASIDSLSVAAAEASEPEIIEFEAIESEAIGSEAIESEAIESRSDASEASADDDADLARALENFDAASAAVGHHQDVADLDALLIAAHGREAIAQVDDLGEDLPDLDFGPTGIATEVIAVEAKPTPKPAPKPAPATPAVAAPSWSLASTDDSERLSVAEAAREFGIEKVSAAAYLTPQVDAPPEEILDPKKIGEAIPRGFASISLELEPLESEEDKKPKNTVAYDTGRDLELPTQVTRPPKREGDATKPKDS